MLLMPLSLVLIGDQPVKKQVKPSGFLPFLFQINCDILGGLFIVIMRLWLVWNSFLARRQYATSEIA
jgi:hypothetical protein